MNKSLRKAVIAGNWKMNKTPTEAKELIAAIAPLVKDAGCDVVACTPFVDLSSPLKAPTFRSALKTAIGRRAVLIRAKFLPICSSLWA